MIKDRYIWLWCHHGNFYVLLLGCQLILWRSSSLVLLRVGVLCWKVRWQLLFYHFYFLMWFLLFCPFSFHPTIHRMPLRCICLFFSVRWWLFKVYVWCTDHCTVLCLWNVLYVSDENHQMLLLASIFLSHNMLLLHLVYKRQYLHRLGTPSSAVLALSLNSRSTCDWSSSLWIRHLLRWLKHPYNHHYSQCKLCCPLLMSPMHNYQC